MNLKIGEQIASLRKKRDLTQEELAGILGVTNQAVSKWESSKCYPDTELLPMIAETFRCSIDTLFSIEKVSGDSDDLCAEFPWADDGVIRGVVCRGREILDIQSGIMHEFIFEYTGDAASVESHCSIRITGDVQGTCSAGRDITVNGSVFGGCSAGDGISVGGDVTGDIMCGDGAECAGSVNGNIIAREITASGDITAETIAGNVVCRTLKCGHIAGEAKMDQKDR